MSRVGILESSSQGEAMKKVSGTGVLGGLLVFACVLAGCVTGGEGASSVDQAPTAQGRSVGEVPASDVSVPDESDGIESASGENASGGSHSNVIRPCWLQCEEDGLCHRCCACGTLVCCGPG